MTMVFSVVLVGSRVQTSSCGGLLLIFTKETKKDQQQLLKRFNFCARQKKPLPKAKALHRSQKKALVAGNTFQYLSIFNYICYPETMVSLMKYCNKYFLGKISLKIQNFDQPHYQNCILWTPALWETGKCFPVSCVKCQVSSGLRALWKLTLG